MIHIQQALETQTCECGSVLIPSGYWVCPNCGLCYERVIVAEPANLKNATAIDYRIPELCPKHEMVSPTTRRVLPRNCFETRVHTQTNRILSTFSLELPLEQRQMLRQSVAIVLRMKESLSVRRSLLVSEMADLVVKLIPNFKPVFQNKRDRIAYERMVQRPVVLTARERLAHKEFERLAKRPLSFVTIKKLLAREYTRETERVWAKVLFPDVPPRERVVEFDRLVREWSG